MDEKYIGLTILDLSNLKNEMEKISGEWDGNNSGIKEERAGIAEEIIEKIDNLILLINNLN